MENKAIEILIKKYINNQENIKFQEERIKRRIREADELIKQFKEVNKSIEIVLDKVVEDKEKTIEEYKLIHKLSNLLCYLHKEKTIEEYKQEHRQEMSAPF